MRTYKGEVERESKSKLREFAFNSMKKAKEGLMIVTFSAALATGFTNNVYGDEKMSDDENPKGTQIYAPQPEQAKNTNIAPVETEKRVFTRSEVFSEINNHFATPILFKKDYSLEGFKSLFKGKQLHEAIESNRSNLKKMGMIDEGINQVIEIAKEYDLSKKDSINLNNLYKPEDLTIMLLLNFAVTKEDNLLDMQKTDVWFAHTLYEQNQYLMEQTEFISTSDLSPEQQIKNLRQKFKKSSPETGMDINTPPVFSSEVEVTFAGALTGNTISKYIKQGSTEGSYVISTDKDNLKTAGDKLQNYLDKTIFTSADERKNVERDLKKIRELEEISKNKFSWRMGAGTGINYNIEGFNIGVEGSVFGGNLPGDKKAEGTASGQIGYAGWFNNILGGYLVGGYNWDGTNFNTHTLSTKFGFNVVLGNPNHVLTLGGKYSHTFETGRSDKRHVWGGTAGYRYKNVFNWTVEPTNASTSMSLEEFLPLTNHFGLFAGVSGDAAYNGIFGLSEKAGARYTLKTKGGNFVFDAFFESTQKWSEKGGLQ